MGYMLAIGLATASLGFYFLLFRAFYRMIMVMNTHAQATLPLRMLAQESNSGGAGVPESLKNDSGAMIKGVQAFMWYLRVALPAPIILWVFTGYPDKYLVLFMGYTLLAIYTGYCLYSLNAFKKKPGIQ